MVWVIPVGVWVCPAIIVIVKDCWPELWVDRRHLRLMTAALSLRAAPTVLAGVRALLRQELCFSLRSHSLQFLLVILQHHFSLVL